MWKQNSCSTSKVLFPSMFNVYNCKGPFSSLNPHYLIKSIILFSTSLITNCIHQGSLAGICFLLVEIESIKIAGKQFVSLLNICSSGAKSNTTTFHTTSRASMWQMVGPEMVGPEIKRFNPSVPWCQILQSVNLMTITNTIMWIKFTVLGFLNPYTSAFLSQTLPNNFVILKSLGGKSSYKRKDNKCFL